MKKAIYILTTIMMMTCVMFFSACENPLTKMKIVLADNMSITLNIDDENPSQGVAEGQSYVAVVANAGKNASRELNIKSVPSELAKCEIIRIDGNSVYYRIEARSSGAGHIELSAKDKSSISATMPITITKTLKSITSSNERYAMQIPNEVGTTEYELPNGSFVLYPSGATSELEYRMLELDAANVGKVSIVGNKLVLKQDKMGEILEDNIKIFAVGKRNSIDTAWNVNVDARAYINVSLVTIPEDDSVVVYTNRADTNEMYKMNTLKSLTLVINETKETSTGSSIYFNRVTLTAGYSLRDVNDTIIDLAEHSFVSDVNIYNITKGLKVPNTNIVSISPVSNNSYELKAVSNTLEGLDTFIDFKIDRIGFDGVFTKTITIKLRVISIPTGYDVSIEDNNHPVVDGAITPTLMDYYQNGRGAKYQFKLKADTAGIDTSYGYRLMVPKAMLSNLNYTNVAMAPNTNRFLIEIFSASGSALQFLPSDSNPNVMISDKLGSGSVLYIKHSVRSENLSLSLPSMTVEAYSSINSQNTGVFSTLTKAQLKVNFKIASGVKYLNFGQYVDETLVMQKDSASNMPIMTIKNANANDSEDAGDNTNISPNDAQIELYTESDGILFVDKDGNEVKRTIYNASNKVVAKRAGDYVVYAKAPNGVTAQMRVKVYVAFAENDVIFALPNDSLAGHIADKYVETEDGIVTVYDVTVGTKLKFDTKVINEDATYEIKYNMTNAAGEPVLNLVNITTNGVFTALAPTHVNNKDKTYLYLDIVVSGVSSFDAQGNAITVTVTEKIKIFIYQPITSFTLSKNNTSVNSMNTLSIFNRESSMLTLNAIIKPVNAYIPTNIVWTVDNLNIGGADNSEYYTLVDMDNGYRTATYQFNLPNDENSAVARIVVKMQQYGLEYFDTCIVHVAKAKLTENLSLDKSYQYDPETKRNYININASNGLNTSANNAINTVTVNAKVSPSEVYDSTVLYYLLKNSKTEQNKDVSDIAILSGSTIVPIGAGRVSLLVVARDALKYSFIPGITDPINAIDTSRPGAYMYIDVIITDGTYESPFMINAASDFIRINNDTGMKSHYIMMNDIYFTDSQVFSAPFGVFSGKVVPFMGSIRTNGDREYTFYNLRIRGVQSVDGQSVYGGLFAIIGDGTDLGYNSIENVCFDIDMRVDYIQWSNMSGGINIGAVTAVNHGKLYNLRLNLNGVISIQVANTVTSTGSSSANVGGMAGTNYGSIDLVDTKLSAVSGQYSVTYSAANNNFRPISYVGGVAGVNREGAGITGAVGTPLFDTAVILESSYGNEGAISEMDIVSVSASSESATGGVVGRSLGGKVANAFVAGSVSGRDNVGGIVGYNEGIYMANTLPQEYDQWQYINSYSIARVSGERHVGGVVGSDKMGSYYYVDSEYYHTASKTSVTYGGTTVSVSGDNYVGGMAGMAEGSKFKYCYVISYKDNNKTPTYDAYYGDILLKNNADEKKYVSSFVAYGKNHMTTSGDISTLEIMSSSSSAKVVVAEHTAIEVYAGGMVAYVYDVVSVKDVYTKGKIKLENQNTSSTHYYLAGIAAGRESETRDGVFAQNMYSTMTFDVGGIVAKTAHEIMPIGMWSSVSGLNSKNIFYINTDGQYVDLITSDVISKEVFGDVHAEVVGRFGEEWFSSAEVNRNLPVISNPYSPVGQDDSLSTELPITISISIKNTPAAQILPNNGKSMMMYYYDLVCLLTNDTIDGSAETMADDAYLLRDRARLNTYNLRDIVDMSVRPLSARSARLIATSSDTTVVQIKEGKLVLLGSGVSTIKVASRLNNLICDTITIHVTRAVDTFEMYQSGDFSDGTYKLSGKTISLGVGMGKTLYTKVSDTLVCLDPIDGMSTRRMYSMAANSGVGVRYTVNSSSAYGKISINGAIVQDGGVHLDTNATAYLEVSEKSVENIVVHATPYIKLAVGNGMGGKVDYEYVYMSSREGVALEKSFAIKTFDGASKVTTDTHQLDVSPVINPTINISISTDKVDDEILLYIGGVKIAFEDLGVIDSDYSYGQSLANSSVPFSITSARSKTIVDGKVNISLTFITTKKYVTSVKDYICTVVAMSSENANATFTISLLPQKMMHFTVENYTTVFESVGSAYEYREYSTKKLLPGQSSILKINVYPEYSEVDFLEIVTESEYKISYEQVLAIGLRHGQTVGSISEPYILTKNQSEAIPNGIRLKKVKYNLGSEVIVDEMETYYVRALIPTNSPSGTSYLVKVRAYKMLNGVKTLVSDRVAQIVLEAQLEPVVRLDYEGSKSVDIYDVANKVGFSVDYTLANVDSNSPSVQILSADKDIASKISYNIDTASNKINIIYLSDALNAQFELKVSASLMINGVENIATDSKRFRVRAMVVNKFSINGLGQNDQIYSSYNEKVALATNLYDTDVSVSGLLANSVAAKETALKMVEEINSNMDYWYIKKKGEETYQKLTANKHGSLLVTMENGRIFIMGDGAEVNDYEFKLIIGYSYDDAGYPYIDRMMNTHTYQKVVGLDFYLGESVQTTTPVYTAKQFADMLAGRKYILMSNIVLEDYVPINTNISSFDGNGYTISIKNYNIQSMLSAESNISKIIRLGLFDTIHSGTIVSNIVMNIPDVSIDIAGVNTFYYGGLAVDNYGMITNCVVKPNKYIDESTLSLTAASSYYNNQYSANSVGTGYINGSALYVYQSSSVSGGAMPAINVAGLVNTNASTGYITNSKVLHGILSAGDISGVVSSNSGKISTTKYEYGLMSNVSERGTDAKSAGFCITNSGSIMLSSAEGAYDKSFVSNNAATYLQATLGGIKTANDAAAFAFDNSGSIDNCMSDMMISSNGKISGFVFDNTKGKMSASYSSSKFAESEHYTPMIGTDDNRKPLGSADTMTNCYYLASGDINAAWLGSPLYANDSTHDMVNTVDRYADKLNLSSAIKNSATDVESYIGYAFALDSSQNGAWTMERHHESKSASLHPKLIAADTIYTTRMKVAKTTVVNGDTMYTYKSDNSAPLGSRLNPYLIYDSKSYTDLMSIGGSNVITSAYRMISDIDMAQLGDSPITTDKVFYGQLDGNGLEIKNINIFAENASKESVGLFKEINSLSTSISERGYIRDLVLKPSLVKATHSVNVGTLAGVLNKGYISNITVDNQDLVVAGQNVVGGIIGSMIGTFEAKVLKSNVSVNSTYRFVSQGRYEIYRRWLDKNIYNNTSSVSYAGAVAGVVDYYEVGNEDNISLSTKTNCIKYAQSYGKVSVVGENTGYVFGYVGESAKVEDISHTLVKGSKLYGTRASGGLVAENRGEIKYAYITYLKSVLTAISAQNIDKVINDKSGKYTYRDVNVGLIPEANIDSFATANYVGGIVGFNNGGIVSAASTISVVSERSYIIGGIVGLMTRGAVNDSYTTSSVFGAKHIGGLVGKIIHANNISSPNNLALIEYRDKMNKYLAGYGSSDTDVFSKITLNNNTANNIWERKYTSKIVNITFDAEGSLIVPDSGWLRMFGGIVGSIQTAKDDITVVMLLGTFANNVYNGKLYLSNDSDIIKLKVAAYLEYSSHGQDKGGLNIDQAMRDEYNTIDKLLGAKKR